MASKTYVSQSLLLTNNLATWSEFIDLIAYIVNQFQTSVDTLLDQIDTLTLRMNAYHSQLDASYIAVDKGYVEIYAVNNTENIENIKIATNVVDSSIYVFANANVDGLYFNDVLVHLNKTYEDMDGTKHGGQPFTVITPNEVGTYELKTTKAIFGRDVKLTFTTAPTLYQFVEGTDVSTTVMVKPTPAKTVVSKLSTTSTLKDEAAAAFKASLAKVSVQKL